MLLHCYTTTGQTTASGCLPASSCHQAHVLSQRCRSRSAAVHPAIEKQVGAVTEHYLLADTKDVRVIKPQPGCAVALQHVRRVVAAADALHAWMQGEGHHKRQKRLNQV